MSILAGPSWIQRLNHQLGRQQNSSWLAGSTSKEPGRRELRQIIPLANAWDWDSRKPHRARRVSNVIVSKDPDILEHPSPLPNSRWMTPITLRSVHEQRRPALPQGEEPVHSVGGSARSRVRWPQPAPGSLRRQRPDYSGGPVGKRLLARNRRCAIEARGWPPMRRVTLRLFDSAAEMTLSLADTESLVNLFPGAHTMQPSLESPGRCG